MSPIGPASPGRSVTFPVWFFDCDRDGALDLFVPSYRDAEHSVTLHVGSSLGYDVPRWILVGLMAVTCRDAGEKRTVAGRNATARMLLAYELAGDRFGDVTNRLGSPVRTASPTC